MFKTNRVYFEVEGEKFMVERYTTICNKDVCTVMRWSPYWEQYSSCYLEDGMPIIFNAPKTKREMMNTAKILAKKNVELKAEC